MVQSARQLLRRVLLAPNFEQFRPFEYHRAALSIAAAREMEAEMLPAIEKALGL